MESEQHPEEAVPVWFGPEESPLFGLVSGAGGEVRGAVVLCPPLAREHTDSYSTFAQLAAALARVGLLALRFDYRSTGDSFDRAGTEETPDGFVEDVRNAIAFVRGLGAPSVALVGMRMGALLAGLASATEPVEAVVMWDPCTSGRMFVRQQRMIGVGIPADQSESSYIPGCHLSPALLNEVSGIELNASATKLAERVLVLTRVGGPDDRGLTGQLASENIELRTVAGQPELLEVPSPFQVVPTEAVAMIAQWLGSAMPQDRHAVALTPADHATVTLAPDPDSVAWPEPRQAVTVTERALRLGEHRLFAISTEPEGGGTGPVLVFVSSGNDHRIGVWRSWVDLSRLLATYGFCCIRLDRNGVGESPGRDAGFRVYALSAIDDVVEAARAVHPRDPSDVVLFGLCSGGYLALEAAARVHPRGVCAVSTLFSFPAPEMEDGSPPDEGRRFFVPQRTYGKSSEVRSIRRYRLIKRYRLVKWLAVRFPATMMRLRVINRWVRTISGRPYRTLLRLVPTRSSESRRGPVQQIGDLARSGTDVLLIGNPDDTKALRGASGRPEWPGTLQLEVLPALDHSLCRKCDRDDITRLIVDAMGQSLRRQSPNLRRRTSASS